MQKAFDFRQNKTGWEPRGITPKSLPQYVTSPAPAAVVLGLAEGRRALVRVAQVVVVEALDPVAVHVAREAHGYLLAGLQDHVALEGAGAVDGAQVVDRVHVAEADLASVGVDRGLVQRARRPVGDLADGPRVAGEHHLLVEGGRDGQGAHEAGVVLAEHEVVVLHRFVSLTRLHGRAQGERGENRAHRQLEAHLGTPFIGLFLVQPLPGQKG